MADYSPYEKKVLHEIELWKNRPEVRIPAEGDQ